MRSKPKLIKNNLDLKEVDDKFYQETFEERKAEFIETEE
jgi:hypothetical protein